MNNSIAQETLDESPVQHRRPGVAGVFVQIIKSPRRIQLLVVGVDILLLIMAFWAFYFIRVGSGLFTSPDGFPVVEFIVMTLIALLPWMLLFWFSGVYVAVHNRSYFDEYYSVLKVILFGSLVIFLTVYFDAVSSSAGTLESRQVVSVTTYLVLVAALVGLGRYFVRGVVRRLRRRGIGLRRTIIVGDSRWSRQLLEMFTEQPELGYAIVGTVMTGSVSVKDQEPGVETPVATISEADASLDFTRRSLGSVAQIDRIIRSESIEVTVLGMQHHRELVLKLMTETTVADTTIKIVPDLYDLISGQARAQHLYGIPLIEVNPKIMPIWAQRSKRLLDVICSVSVLLIGLPVWLMTIALIKLEDHGPVYYSQERVGLGGNNFMIHKFRSMRTDAERDGITWAATNDPRVTRVGRIIRKLHVDEIPQFWNILLGEMSVVGPRPERPFFVEKYTNLLPSYPRRHRVKPGLTGWNQIQAEELVETVEIVSEKLRHDFFYIENMSLRLDFEIILRTVIRILKRKGQT